MNRGRKLDFTLDSPFPGLYLDFLKVAGSLEFEAFKSLSS